MNIQLFQLFKARTSVKDRLAMESCTLSVTREIIEKKNGAENSTRRLLARVVNRWS